MLSRPQVCGACWADADSDALKGPPTRIPTWPQTGQGLDTSQLGDAEQVTLSSWASVSSVYETGTKTRLWGIKRDGQARLVSRSASEGANLVSSLLSLGPLQGLRAFLWSSLHPPRFPLGVFLFLASFPPTLPLHFFFFFFGSLSLPFLLSVSFLCCESLVKPC